jgi:3'-phosphoadenosine 5'-phosphosulfate (PAPS) 3'-phosphatase
VVTQADRAVEAAIRAVLADAQPDDAVLARVVKLGAGVMQADHGSGVSLIK